MKYHSIKQAKQQAASLRPGQFRHVLRVAAITGRMRERDVMLLWVITSTGIRVTELSLLEIRDIMHPSPASCGPRSIYGVPSPSTATPGPSISATPRPWPPWRPGWPTGSNGARKQGPLSHITPC